LNVSSDGDDVTVAGKLFHTRAAATGKAQSPTVDKRLERVVRGMDRWLVVKGAQSKWVNTIYKLAQRSAKADTEAGSIAGS